MAFLGAIYGIIFLLIGLVQIYFGFIGIEYHLGTVWAFIAIFLALWLRIMLPLTIGTFFGVLTFGWPWYIALAITVPGLLFILPVLVTGALGTLFNKNN